MADNQLMAGDFVSCWNRNGKEWDGRIVRENFGIPNWVGCVRSIERDGEPFCIQRLYGGNSKYCFRGFDLISYRLTVGSL